MNILERAKHLANGVEFISNWIGDGGIVVDKEEAQGRANICLACPNNKLGLTVAAPVAAAVRKYLEFKNELELRVDGEKKLGSCELCGCELRLQIWETPDRIRSQMTPEETAKAPKHCWKLNA